MPVAGRDDGSTVDFHPGVIPHFDAWWVMGFRRVVNFQVYAPSKPDIVKMKTGISSPVHLLS